MTAATRKLLRRWRALAARIDTLPDAWNATGSFPLLATCRVLVGVIELRPALEALAPCQGIDRQVVQITNALRAIIGTNDLKRGDEVWRWLEGLREPTATLTATIERAAQESARAEKSPWK